MGVATTVSNTYDSAIEACARCSQGCWEAFEACLSADGIDARARCVKMLAECAHVCELTGAALASNAVLAREYCKLCASACELCAKNCEMFRDEHCALCAEVCHDCAKELKEAE